MDDAGSLTCYSCDPLDPSSKPHLLKSWKIFFWGEHFPHHASTDHNTFGSEWLTQPFRCLPHQLQKLLVTHRSDSNVQPSTGLKPFENGDPIGWMIWCESQYSSNLLRNFRLSASAFLSVVLSVRTTEVPLLCDGGRPAWEHSPAFHSLWILQEPPWL